MEIEWDDEPYEVATLPDWFKDDDTLSFEDVLHALGTIECECGHYNPDWFSCFGAKVGC